MHELEEASALLESLGHDVVDLPAAPLTMQVPASFEAQLDQARPWQPRHAPGW